jgi:hypothetical protein
VTPAWPDAAAGLAEDLLWPCAVLTTRDGYTTADLANGWAQVWLMANQPATY